MKSLLSETKNQNPLIISSARNLSWCISHAQAWAEFLKSDFLCHCYRLICCETAIIFACFLWFVVASTVSEKSIPIRLWKINNRCSPIKYLFCEHWTSCSIKRSPSNTKHWWTGLCSMCLVLKTCVFQYLHRNNIAIAESNKTRKPPTFLFVCLYDSDDKKMFQALEYFTHLLYSVLSLFCSVQFCATLGTTPSCAFDHITELGPICECSIYFPLHVSLCGVW